MRKSLVALLSLVVGSAALPAMALVYTYDFNSGGGGTTNPYWDTGANNSGGENPSFRLGNVAAVTLFKVVLPGDLAGATINSATLTIQPQWGGSNTFGGVQMFEINPTAPEWFVGNGLWSNRWGPADNGATKLWANHIAAGGGVDWTGATVGADWQGAGTDASTVFGSLLDTKDMAGTGVNTFNVRPAVQDWANGSANRGLALSILNMTGGYNVDGSAYNFTATGAGLGLSINYSIPEPATIGLLTVGSLTLLRRRRRVA